MDRHIERTFEIDRLLQEVGGTINIAYSGGKDSSAVVSLMWHAIQLSGGKYYNFQIIYCDTEVENPILDFHAKNCLIQIENEAEKNRLPISTKILRPRIDQGFFVRIIGRGYPPPTNSFRWCTKDIRIRPIRHYLANQNSRTWVAIGTRWGESHQRDRALRKISSVPSEHPLVQKQKDGFPNATLVTPVIDYSTEDIWELLCENFGPAAIDPYALADIYKKGGGECPTFRDFKDKPCSKSRFGCWTCTVVRRDKSSEKLIQSGHAELEPYLKFRNWLSQIRNEPRYRCKKRRNGAIGPGPFTIEARLIILKNLRDLEAEIGTKIISEEQYNEIKRLHDLDRNSPTYMEIE